MTRMKSNVLRMEKMDDIVDDDVSNDGVLTKMMNKDLGLKRERVGETLVEAKPKRKPLRGKRRGKKAKEREEDRRNTIVMLAYLGSKSTDLSSS